MSTTTVITSRKGAAGLATELAELWQFRHLLGSLIRRELGLKYRGSIIRMLWTFATPLAQILAMTFVVRYVLGAGTKNATIYIMCGYLPWNFFQASVMESTVAIIGYYGILKKVYFPREIPILVTVCSNFINLLISIVIFAVIRWGIFPLFTGPTGPPPRELLLLPLILVLTFLFTASISLLVTAINYFYEDIRFMTQMVINFMLYLLPIMYNAEMIMNSTRIPSPNLRWVLYHLYLVNPLAWIVQAFKQIFFGVVNNAAPGSNALLPGAKFDYVYLELNIVTILLITVGSYHWFNQLKWKFTERP